MTMMIKNTIDNTYRASYSGSGIVLSILHILKNFQSSQQHMNEELLLPYDFNGKF